MHVIHKYRISEVNHLQCTRSKIPVTDVSYFCITCGKPKFKRIEGYFTQRMLEGKL